MAALTGVVPERALRAPNAEGRWASLGRTPDAVVRPASADEASAVLGWASAEGVGVVLAGTGRRLGPHRMPGPFVVVTTEALTGFEVYEPADLTFTARAGTPMRAVDAALRENGQWAPFDPPDVLGRTLGGLVATGDSGPLWHGYGAIRNHVLGMTVVTGDGRTLKLGGRVVKNVAGFDLLKPMVGSRGRLALVTSVTMRAFPEPAAERVVRLRAERVADLLAAALAVGTAPLLPVSAVLVTSPPRRAELRVRLHGGEPTLDADIATLEAHVGSRFERMDEAAATGGEAGSDALGAEAETVVVATVLPSRLAEALSALERLEPTGLHADPLAARVRVGLRRLEASALADVRRALESLGGALAVERAPLDADVRAVASAPSADEGRLGARIEEVFDPARVLWRGAGS